MQVTLSVSREVLAVCEQLHEGELQQGQTCSKAEINQGLVDAVKAYKAQLSVEAKDGQCVDSSLL